ncbi:MAG TPA: GAF domain-containing protein, partial [Candidatus Omnitrophota bacterium]|nr:GAF domain-containing protein [Candidatus Omnitrophota bacterium]
MKEQRRYQESLKHAAIGMTRIHDLKRLLKLIAHIVTRKVGIAFTSIYLYDENEGVYSLQVSHDKGRKPIPMVSASQDIIQWFQAKAIPLVREEIQRFALESRDKIFSELEVEMKLLEAELIIPSFLDKRLIGFIVLGEKLSGAMYSSDDISVFQVLASQAALAIENAQFYSEAKEMQAQISQAEKMATVGTMADGLSHQINNRFYALSLIAGDTLDTLRLTDAAKCSPEVQSMLKEINTALERIQVNVMQGGEVVKGILRYTRKGDEGLVALTMDQIIDGTLDMVQFKV